jgi:hypothetical protein
MRLFFRIPLLRDIYRPAKILVRARYLGNLKGSLIHAHSYHAAGYVQNKSAKMTI